MMIRRCDPLGHILLMGEWKSLSVLRYIIDENVDPNRLMEMQFEALDNEGSDAEAEEDDKSDDG